MRAPLPMDAGTEAWSGRERKRRGRAGGGYPGSDGSAQGLLKVEKGVKVLISKGFRKIGV